MVDLERSPSDYTFCDIISTVCSASQDSSVCAFVWLMTTHTPKPLTPCSIALNYGAVNKWLIDSSQLQFLPSSKSHDTKTRTMAGFLTFKGSWPWTWIGSYCILSGITHWPLLRPTCQSSLKSKKLLWMDGRRHIRTYGQTASAAFESITVEFEFRFESKNEPS